MGSKKPDPRTKQARREKARTKARKAPRGRNGLVSVHVRVPAEIYERIVATGVAAFRKANAQTVYLLGTHPEIRALPTAGEIRALPTAGTVPTASPPAAPIAAPIAEAASAAPLASESPSPLA